ncbi:MAG: hypothetical protein GDA51_07580 [Ekhidna sp.]|nr:hypothetical protein [Ekhidna sp.]MBC6426317.1 hypothetical protein [Ekhidna sp.]
MFPEANDPFWVSLLRKRPQVSTMALRLLLGRLQKKFENEKITENEAASELIVFFNKYKSMCKKEFQLIKNQL